MIAYKDGLVRLSPVCPHGAPRRARVQMQVPPLLGVPYRSAIISQCADNSNLTGGGATYTMDAGGPYVCNLYVVGGNALYGTYFSFTTQ
jgi:hypothetical protein